MCAQAAAYGIYIDSEGFTRCGYCGEIAGWIPVKAKEEGK